MQARALETSLAIREAFVRLLDEQPYERVTIREIALVAGVGLGTFYEYFRSKDDLARTTVHLRTKALLLSLRRRRGEPGSYDLSDGVHAAVDALVALIAQKPSEWTQHFLLERQKSDLEYYQVAYEQFVEEWREMIAGACDWPDGAPAAPAARTVFTLVYGMLTHAMLRAGGPSGLAQLQSDLECAALACLSASRGRGA